MLSFGLKLTVIAAPPDAMAESDTGLFRLELLFTGTSIERYGLCMLVSGGLLDPFIIFAAAALSCTPSLTPFTVLTEETS